jgi:hypothetical protein
MVMLNGYVQRLSIQGNTPIFKCLKLVLDTKVANRIILFSDGAPTDDLEYDDETYLKEAKLPKYCAQFKAAGIPIDTCFIGRDTKNAANFMRELAEGTDGIFLHFTGPETFKAGLKYLSPGKRHLLANAELKAKIQRGEEI